MLHRLCNVAEVCPNCITLENSPTHSPCMFRHIDLSSQFLHSFHTEDAEPDSLLVFIIA